jgi:hypothetical protein
MLELLAVQWGNVRKLMHHRELDYENGKLTN